VGPGCLQRSPRPASWNKGDLLLSEGEKYNVRNEKGGQGQAGEGKDEREEGREWRGPAVCIFKFSLVYAIIGQSHNICKRVKMTFHHSIVV